ncbi:hypothetical protein CMI37_01065 [Candidatus Pacearchaeota archaeon]|nr:hypothetical protein [Candidatus Pacearchaeota archaeon]
MPVPRANPDEPVSYGPKKLNSRHREMVRLMAAGSSVVDAAEVVGFSLSTARVVASSPKFKEEMERMQGEMDKGLVETYVYNYKEKLGEEIKQSIETLVELRDGAESEQVKLRAAGELLDRAGIKTADKIEADVMVEVDGDLAGMLNTALVEMRSEGEASEQG